jgi:hypothetical protein
MPIRDIQKPTPRLSRIGIIRLGMKVQKQSHNGKTVEVPTDANYFLLHDAPEVQAVYGEEPQELLVYLPFGSVDENFPAHHELWSATGCLCRGDGVRIVDRMVGTKRTIRGGEVYMDYSEEDGQGYTVGDVVACPGLDRTDTFYARCKDCRPRGMLIVLVRDPHRPTQLINDRLGYYQISTHSFYNIQNLTGQLHYAEELAANMGRSLQGIPMILRRVAREITYTDGKKDERRTTTKWLLDLEFDAEWVRAANTMIHERALTATPTYALPAGAVIDAETGEILDEYESEGASFDDSGQGAVENLQGATQQMKQTGLRGDGAVNRPYPPDEFRSRFSSLRSVFETRNASEPGSIDKKLRGALVGRLNAMFDGEAEPDKHRRTFLRFVTGEESSKKLSQAEGKLFMQILDDGSAISEVRAIVRQDAVDKGQTEFEFTRSDKQSF